MGLVEILAILILVGVLTAIALLAVLLLRKKTDTNMTDPAAIAATIAELLNVELETEGKSFASEVVLSAEV